MRPDYVRNKRAYYARTRANVLKLQEYARLYKSKPCMDCGIQYPYYVMELDHVRGQKRNLQTVIKNGSMRSLLLELDKCDLVCANCHRERTAARAGYSTI